MRANTCSSTAREELVRHSRRQKAPSLTKALNRASDRIPSNVGLTRSHGFVGGDRLASRTRSAANSAICFVCHRIHLGTIEAVHPPMNTSFDSDRSAQHASAAETASSESPPSASALTGRELQVGIRSAKKCHKRAGLCLNQHDEYDSCRNHLRALRPTSYGGIVTRLISSSRHGTLGIDRRSPDVGLGGGALVDEVLAPITSDQP